MIRARPEIPVHVPAALLKSSGTVLVAADWYGSSRPSLVRKACWIRTSRSEEHTSELQSQSNLVCRLLLEKKKKILLILERADQFVLDAYADLDEVGLFAGAMQVSGVMRLCLVILVSAAVRAWVVVICATT